MLTVQALKILKHLLFSFWGTSHESFSKLQQLFYFYMHFNIPPWVNTTLIYPNYLVNNMLTWFIIKTHSRGFSHSEGYAAITDHKSYCLIRPKSCLI